MNLDNKVCLITPPSPFLLDERVFMHIGVLKVASALESKGVPVDVIDLSGVDNFDDVISDYLKSENSAKIFGITATTPQVPYAVKIAQQVR